MKIIETDRLILRKFTLEDAAFMLELLNTPAFLKYIGDRGVRSLVDARKYIKEGPLKSYQNFGFGFYVVELLRQKISIGMCGLVKRPTLEDIDIGFAFLPAHIGKGYGYESASAVMEYAERELQLNRIVAITAKNNQNSIRLLEKIGMAFEKMIQFPPDNEEIMLFSNQKNHNQSIK